MLISTYDDKMVTFNHVSLKNPKDMIFNLHTHDICEIIYLKQGDISAVIDNKMYKLQRNSLIIFRTRIPHKIQIDSNIIYRRYNILFDELALANGVFDRLPKDLDVINFSEDDPINDIFKKLDYYYNNFSGKDLEILVKNTVEEILFHIYLVPAKLQNSETASAHPIVSDAIEYINENYTKNITIDDISTYLGITKSHLHHLFSDQLKISPKKYINIKRLSKAQTLIRNGEMPSKIYYRCGFTDYGTFFRNYTSYFGYTPSQKDEIVIERKIES